MVFGRQMMVTGLLAPTLVAGSCLMACSCDTADRVNQANTEEPSESETSGGEGQMSRPPESTSEATVEDDRRRVARAVNGFAASVYPHVAAGAPDGNLVFSPASIVTAFSMVHLGAAGESAAELGSALHVDGERDAYHTSVGRVLSDWQAPHERGTILRVANRLFGERGFSFERDYLAQSGSLYRAPLEALDFSGAPEPQRVHINNWVAEQTENRITDLLPERSITSDTRLVLTNAIYFKARWMRTFQQAATRRERFFRGSRRDAVPVQMMYDQGYHRHHTVSLPSGSNIQVLELPYADSGFSMVVLLPQEVGGLPALEAALTADRLQEWLQISGSENIKLHLPKWRTEQSTGLRRTLEALGVRRLFEPDFANLEAIGQPLDGKKLYVTEGYHKAFVEVDEEGTEAAAATAVVMAAGAGMPAEPEIEFRADHPFLYLIRDTRSGAILFMGRLQAP